MVQSGLVDNPDVSQYRLAAHLGLAFLIFGLLWLTALEVRREVRPERASAVGLLAPAALLNILVFLQIVIGAFVAGTNAGFTINTWPSMDGDLIPPGLFDLQPWWLSAFEDVVTIQFLHRMTAYLIVIVAVWTFFRCRRCDARRAGTVVLHVVTLQVALGIATLLAVVPVWLGALHQAMAVIVWATGLTVLHISLSARTG